MPGQAGQDVISLLNASLDEEEHVEAAIEDGPNRANLVILEGILAEAKVRDLRLIVLLAVFDAEVVDFYVVTMPLFE